MPEITGTDKVESSYKELRIFECFIKTLKKGGLSKLNMY